MLFLHSCRLLAFKRVHAKFSPNTATFDWPGIRFFVERCPDAQISVAVGQAGILNIAHHMTGPTKYCRKMRAKIAYIL